jgi:hypothetical protein
MTDQERALRLADELDGIPLADMTEALADDAAAELRRLRAENGELLEALHALLFTADDSPSYDAAITQARAAIARAEGEKT